MCLLFSVSSCQEPYCLFNAADDFGCSLKKNSSKSGSKFSFCTLFFQPSSDTGATCASLEIQVDPLESSASTRPCTVARSLWWEGAATLALLAPPLSSENQFFFFHGRVRADQNPPSVIRNGWYGWSKPPIRHADRMVWVNGPGMRERRGRSVTPKTDKTTVKSFERCVKKILFLKRGVFSHLYFCYIMIS